MKWGLFQYKFLAFFPMREPICPTRGRVKSDVSLHSTISSNWSLHSTITYSPN